MSVKVFISVNNLMYKLFITLYKGRLNVKWYQFFSYLHLNSMQNLNLWGVPSLHSAQQINSDLKSDINQCFPHDRNPNKLQIFSILAFLKHGYIDNHKLQQINFISKIINVVRRLPVHAVSGTVSL